MAKKLKISYETLRSLSEGLYSNLVTVISELISNSWDADAENVNILIEEDCIKIIDDGHGMNSDEFEEKFLEVGFSKRDNSSESESGKRFVMGRKGIGKLAVVALADKAIILTKREGQDFTGGIIDSEKLKESSKTSGIYAVDDITQEELKYKEALNNSHGTIIILKGIKKHVRRSDNYIRPRISTYFQVEHLLNKGDSFKISINGVYLSSEKELSIYSRAQFAWYFDSETKNMLEEKCKNLDTFDDGQSKEFGINKFANNSISFKKHNGEEKEIKIRGHVLSYRSTNDLKMKDLKLNLNNISLFAHGRRRVENIIEYIENNRLVKNYLLGVIHIDGLDDDDIDRFTTNRENILEYDPLYEKVLDFLKESFKQISREWDKGRREMKDSATDDTLDKKTINYINFVGKNLVNSTELKSKEKKSLLSGEKFSQVLKDGKAMQESFIRIYIAENIMRNIYNKPTDGWSTEIEERINKVKNSLDTIDSLNVSHKLISYDDDKYKVLFEHSVKLSHEEIKKIIPNDEKRNKIHPNFDSSYKEDGKILKAMRNLVMHSVPLTDDAKGLVLTRSANIIAKIKKMEDAEKNS